MLNNSCFSIQFYLSDIKTFKRQNGKTGQCIITKDNSKYEYRVDCVDKEDFDFTSLKSGKYSFLAIPKLRVENIKTPTSLRYVTIPTFVLVGVDKEL